MKLINLTPHDVVLMKEGVVETIPSTGLTRVQMTQEVIGSINGYPVAINTYGEVIGLPNKETDTIYIVSALVAAALGGSRDDVVVVNNTVRDTDGKIIGATGFARILWWV